jgi:2-oxoglutarate ferredoxin oxidoreductase subunit beta
MRWPGFAFIEVLSPCITFRPEQREWKKQVRTSTLSIEQDRAAATALVLADDGFSLGVLYRGDRAPVAPPLKPQVSVADIEREFAITD